MKQSYLLPNLFEFKTQARLLRARLAHQGRPIKHSRSLEIIAKQWGFQSWNALSATTPNYTRRPSPSKPAQSEKTISGSSSISCRVTAGQSVKGRYLGQAFTAQVLGVQCVRHIKGAGQYRLSLHCDAPIDVVKFNSFSSWRRRLVATIDHKAQSRETTSDGTPHLILDL